LVSRGRNETSPQLARRTQEIGPRTGPPPLPAMSVTRQSRGAHALVQQSRDDESSVKRRSGRPPESTGCEPSCLPSKTTAGDGAAEFKRDGNASTKCEVTTTTAQTKGTEKRTKKANKPHLSQAKNTYNFTLTFADRKITNDLISLNSCLSCADLHRGLHPEMPKMRPSTGCVRDKISERLLRR
jgi:hypothetical protein